MDEWDFVRPAMNFGLNQLEWDKLYKLVKESLWRAKPAEVVKFCGFIGWYFELEMFSPQLGYPGLLRVAMTAAMAPINKER